MATSAKLWHRLAPRIAVLSLVSAVISIVITAVVTAQITMDAWSDQMGTILADELSRADPHSCLSHGPRYPGGPRVDGYDADTLAPADPTAPRLVPHLVQQELGSRRTSTRVRWLRDPAVEILVRTGRSGPCGVYRITWDRDVPRRLSGALSVLLVAVPPVTLLAVFGTVMVLRPIVRRIRAKADAAMRMGTGAFDLESDPDRDEVAELGEQLARAHARIVSDSETLKSAHTALEHHMANVAHDLRTPMASLRLKLESAMDETSDASTRVRLADSLAEAVYLSDLVDNLWVATQLEHGKQSIQEHTTNLTFVVQRLEARFAPLCRPRGVELGVAYPDHDVWIRGTSTMVQQAVGNLVQNALSYGNEGGHIAVVLEARAGAFVLSVLDDGPGVPPDDLANLMDRTFRGKDARSRNPSGGGLGLAITHDVCVELGFALTFAPAEPAGLHVTVSGTYFDQPGEAPPGTRPSGASLHGAGDA